MDKPSLPSGTRDFSPAVVARRRFITGAIESVYRLHGFYPLETPSMENLSVLLGKYGDEGDRLVFRILNSGDFMQAVPDAAKAEGSSRSIAPHIAEKGLRYDLTVPFARFVVMNRHALQFPFRRYQIQPVWRADRPQKGRYREFWQCDADIIGTDSLMAEADLMSVFHAGFTALGLGDYVIRIGNRKILEGLAVQSGRPELFRPMVTALDKWDKIGVDGVKTQLSAAGFTEAEATAITAACERRTLDNTAIDNLAARFADNATALEGVEELRGLLSFGTDARMEYDGTLARGLDYYTGCIFEVEIPNSGIGSVASGGRYANLTGVFGVPGLSGVGISFGLDRLYDVLDARNGFPADTGTATQVLFCPMDSSAQPLAFRLAAALRRNGTAAEVYPDAVKLKKQLEHAGNRGIPFAVIIGSQEMETGEFTFRHMLNGSQEKVTEQELYSRFRS